MAHPSILIWQPAIFHLLHASSRQSGGSSSKAQSALFLHSLPTKTANLHRDPPRATTTHDSPPATRHLPPATRHLRLASRDPRPATCHLPPATATRDPPPATRLPRPATRHPPPATAARDLPPSPTTCSPRGLRPFWLAINQLYLSILLVFAHHSSKMSTPCLLHGWCLVAKFWVVGA